MYKTILALLILLLSVSVEAYEPSLDPRIINLLDSRHYDGTKKDQLKLSPGQGNNWYIDGTNGHDDYDGRHPDWIPGTNKGPKRTIRATIQQYVDPGKGARVMIKAGTYYETWPWFYGPPYWSQNDENNRMIIGPYGDGEVIVTQQLDLRDKRWEPHTKNIFKIQTDMTGGGGTFAEGIHQVIIDNDFRSFHMVTSTKNPGLKGVQKYGDWWWDNKTGWLYVFTGGFNPDDRDTIVLDNSGPEDERWSMYFSYNPSYITFYGLTFVGSKASPWVSSGSHINFDNCRFMFANRAGLSIYKDLKYCRITRNLVYGNVMNNWPRGHRSDNNVDGLWQAALAPSATSYVAGNIVMDNGGEGIQGIDDAIIEDNIVVDNFSVGIYVGVGANQIVRRNIILATRQDPYDLYGWPEKQGQFWAKIRRKLRQMGITMAAEDPSGHFTNARIYNNLIIGSRYGISSAEGKGSFGIKNSDIFNNIIITPDGDAQEFEDIYVGILMSNWGERSYNSFIRNNIVICQYPVHTTLAQRGPIKKGPDDGISWDNNIYFAPADMKYPFMEYYGPGKYTLASWQKAFGVDKNSIFADPQLNRSDWSDVSALKLSDFQTRDGSPARDRGEALLEQFATDYNFGKRPHNSGWDIGAFEAGAEPDVPSCRWDGEMCSGDDECCGGFCCQSRCAGQMCFDRRETSSDEELPLKPVDKLLVRNLALNQKATASTIHKSLDPQNAVDGSSRTRWQADASDPQWIAVDLGQRYHISRMVLHWVDLGAAKSYSVQVSDDGVQWTDVLTKANGLGGKEELPSISGRGRYVRIFTTERSNTYGVSLYEIEVYGSQLNK